MNLYSSTQYIEDPKIGDLQLVVNSMWDFKSRDVCFQSIEKTFGGGTEVISYDLKECTGVQDGIIIGGTKKCKNTKWKPAIITQEIISKLTADGYTVSKSFTNQSKE
jgi:stress response protein SCP2